MIYKKSKGAKLIIVYDDKTQDLIMNKWGHKIKDSISLEYSNNGKRSQKYKLYFGDVSNKNTMFLFTPFLEMVRLVIKE